MPYLLVVLALVLLVVLHELGHFLAARAVGIRATKFYVFFPPALLKKTIGEVEYGLGAIPAGGFVKLPGMFEPVPAEVAARVRADTDVLASELDAARALRLDASVRAIEQARGADALIEPLREVDELLTGIESGEDEEGRGSTPAQQSAAARARGRVRSLLDDAHPQAYWRASLWRRMTVIVAGPAVNLVVALLVLTTWFWVLQPSYEVNGPLRVEVERGSPAAEAGLTERSRIVDWNGAVEGVGYEQLARRITGSIGEPVEVSWREGAAGEVRSARIVPERLDAEDEGPRIGITAFGVPKEIVGHRTTSFGHAARTSLSAMGEVTWGNVSRLPRIFFDREVREGVGSVVGIVEVAEDVDEAGLFVYYVGFISLILAVMNLLPLLPLDGGHLLFGLIEKARRGRTVPRAAYERYSFVGIALVLTLFVIELDNDIGRFG